MKLSAIADKLFRLASVNLSRSPAVVVLGVLNARWRLRATETGLKTLSAGSLKTWEVLPMDGVDRWVSEQNVWRFIDRLTEEPEPDERVILAHMLLREEDKFAKDVERFETVQRWIDRCDGNLARHNGLLENAPDADRARIRMTIHIIHEIRNTLVSFRTTWAIDMNEATKFAEKY
jgi:hypothetical protein